MIRGCVNILAAITSLCVSLLALVILIFVSIKLTDISFDGLNYVRRHRLETVLFISIGAVPVV
jgi:hypothetical protein